MADFTRLMADARTYWASGRGHPQRLCWEQNDGGCCAILAAARQAGIPVDAMGRSELRTRAAAEYGVTEDELGQFMVGFDTPEYSSSTSRSYPADQDELCGAAFSREVLG